jgi:copper homeostasis protein CutC
MNNKDNPVPSIDNTIEWLLSLSVPQVFTHELRQDIIENLEELQNGVETDNGQPKRCKCGLLVKDKSKHYH